MPTTPKHTPKAGVISIVKTDQVGSAGPNIPHRPAPPVAASKTYQEPENKANLLRKSSSSSTPSPVHDTAQMELPEVQSLCIHDQDTGAIYEEIDDDVVSPVDSLPI